MKVSIGLATIVGYALAAAGMVLALAEGNTDFAKWGAVIATFTGGGRQLQAAAAAHATGQASAEPLSLPSDAQELAEPPPDREPVEGQMVSVPAPPPGPPDVVTPEWDPSAQSPPQRAPEG